ncbi:hypothetical protein LCGC14_1399260, partial [marine sediment metagenome]
MVDDSELDYLRTFLLKVHTTAGVEHVNEVGVSSKIVDAGGTKIWVGHGELIATDSRVRQYEKKYLVKLQDITEALLTTMLNNILIGIWKLQTWQTIAAYTRETSLISLKIVSGSKITDHKKKNYRMEI